MTFRLGDIVLPNATEDELRVSYGEDADEVIAFRRFLRLPTHEEDGRTIFECPPHWMAYGKAEISGAEAIRLDDEWKKTHP